MFSHLNPNCTSDRTMKTILFGLLQGLGGWIAVSALMSWILQSQYGMRATDTIGMSIFGGGFAWASFGLFVSSFGCWRERAAILGGVSGTPPVDGKHAVLVGTIEPSGSRLQAPLDGSQCVMYTYEIRFDVGSGKSRSFGTIARGIGLAPSRIVTRAGSYKLLVVPNLEGDSPANSSAARIERFLRYAHQTTFTKKEDSAKELLAQWADDDGAYRSDVAYFPIDDANTQYWQPHQQHVPPGARVCVFGPYSKAKGGIVPSITKPVRLICGSIEDVAATLKSQMITRSIIGTFLAAPLVVAFLVNR